MTCPAARFGQLISAILIPHVQEKSANKFYPYHVWCPLRISGHRDAGSRNPRLAGVPAADGRNQRNKDDDPMPLAPQTKKLCLCRKLQFQKVCRLDTAMILDIMTSPKNNQLFTVYYSSIIIVTWTGFMFCSGALMASLIHL